MERCRRQGHPAAVPDNTCGVWFWLYGRDRRHAAGVIVDGYARREAGLLCTAARLAHKDRVADKRRTNDVQMYGHLSPGIESAYVEAVRECPFWGNKKRIWSAGAYWKSERSLLRKQKQNKCNVAILHGSKQIGGQEGAETIQYRILRALQLLPSSGIKASVRFSTERKTNGALLQRCKSREGGPWHTQGRHIAAFGAETIIFISGMKRGRHGAIRGHGGGCICRLLFYFWDFCCMME